MKEGTNPLSNSLKR